MSDNVNSVEEVIERLTQHDPTLTRIDFGNEQCTDADLSALIDCLLVHPDVATHVNLERNKLTDETGVKLARYVAASSTIRYLTLHENRFSETTFMAIITALRVNTSLKGLTLHDNQAVNTSRVDAAIVETMHVNPSHATNSQWHLHSQNVWWQPVPPITEAFGAPPSMLSQLSVCDSWREKNKF